MPEEYLDECLELIEGVRDKGTKILIDTSGSALKSISKMGGIDLVKPRILVLTRFQVLPPDENYKSV